MFLQRYGGDKEWRESERSSRRGQLKFLQKSNEDQMASLKLFTKSLWLCIVILYHLPDLHAVPARKFPPRDGRWRHVVCRRVGFSGMPSIFSRRAWTMRYETGDDGKMLSTVLDDSIVDYASCRVVGGRLPHGNCHCRRRPSRRRFHALITQEPWSPDIERAGGIATVAALSWCEAFISRRKRQTASPSVRRAGSCRKTSGVLCREFAFYDQIHTTGMDIKHVQSPAVSAG